MFKGIEWKPLIGAAIFAGVVVAALYVAFVR